eukprot:5535345-Pyramimonas_sp.AAC.1
MWPRSSRGVCRHEPRPPCEPCQWGLRWSSLRGHDPRGGCPKWPEAAMRTLPLVLSAKLPMRPRSS